MLCRYGWKSLTENGNKYRIICTVFVMFSGDQSGADSGRRPDTAALGVQLYCFQLGQSDINTMAGIWQHFAFTCHNIASPPGVKE